MRHKMPFVTLRRRMEPAAGHVSPGASTYSHLRSELMGIHNWALFDSICSFSRSGKNKRPRNHQLCKHSNTFLNNAPRETLLNAGSLRRKFYDCVTCRRFVDSIIILGRFFGLGNFRSLRPRDSLRWRVKTISSPVEISNFSRLDTISFHRPSNGFRSSSAASSPPSYHMPDRLVLDGKLVFRIEIKCSWTFHASWIFLVLHLLALYRRLRHNRPANSSKFILWYDNPSAIFL